MAKAAESKAPEFDALPALSEAAIARTRAFWRHLAWQLLPETFVGTDAGKDEVDLPSPSNASLLAMLRALHGTRVNEDAKAQRDAARSHLHELLEADQAAGPASRLDLATDLFGIDGQARLALELVAVSEVDTLTAHSARVLSSRLQRDGGHDINLLDDCFAVAGLGAGTIRRLCGPRGTLRNIGAVIERDDSGVGLSATVLDFLDGRLDAPSPLDEHAVRLRLPSEGLQTLGRQRSTWTAVLERAVGLGRPVLLSGMPGFGGPAMVALMAANRGLAWRGVHAQPLVDDETGHVSDLMPVLHAEARLHGVVQVIHHLERLEKTFRENLDCLRRFVDALIRIERPIVLVHEGPVAAEIGVHLAIEAGLIHIEVQPMPVEERGELLRVCLSAGGLEEDDAEKLAEAGKHYSLGPDQAAAAVAFAQQRAQLRAARAAAEGDALDHVVPTIAEVRHACSTAMTNRLRKYGSRVICNVSWDDLVLPDEQLDAVRDLARFARVRDKLFDTFGFGDKLSYGRALSAMFSGPSGTGKTMVAGLIAKDLGVELYRVDLSRVVSKYIGETEERLGALFDEAGQVGAALLFDEADSLFGRRTEIKSANDRYANLEVNYLLQRLEDFEGVVILTTNFGTSIDEAFVRRLRFRIQFPLPGPTDRARMWQVMLPEALPLDEDDPLDLDWMGETFELSGGHIRNTVLRAGMLAADGDDALTMRMLYDAAAAEYRELGKLAPAYPFDDDW